MAMNGDRGSQNDAIISIESTAEWQVHDILYDGQERYLAPLTFSDYVAKYARKVDWRKLVGSETSADDYNEQDDDEEAADNAESRRVESQQSTENELQKLLSAGRSQGKETAGDEPKTEAEFGDEPEEWTSSVGPSKSSLQDQDAGAETSQRGVGPWDSAAKRLLQSLTEMNVLLDAIRVARSGKYLVLDSVQQEAVEQPKNAVIAAKKKALTSASCVLHSLADQLRPKTASSSPSVQQQLDPELEELIEMRRNWRLKKVGNNIVGDLSYFAVGKYRLNATFEVRKTETTTSDGLGALGSPVIKSQSAKRQNWEVVLPKDLEESLHLSVIVETADGEALGTATYFGKRPFPKFGGGGWQEKLQLAQRTLFCKDLFAQLAREAAHIQDLCCAVRGRSIILRLPNTRSLVVSLVSYSEDQESSGEHGSTNGSSFVLEHNLQQLFDVELEGANEVIIPHPVTAPLTHLSKKARLAGPEALSVYNLTSENESDKLLLQRLFDLASHYLLYQRTKAVVDEFAAACSEPVISVHWCPETTGIWSTVKIQMSTPFYEFCGKTFLLLEIHVREIKVTLREGEVVTLSSNLDELTHFLNLRAKQHIISAVGTLCRPHQWQTLYSNPIETDEQGFLTPAIMMGHPAGTSAVSIKYPLNGDPSIFVQTTSDCAKSFKSDLLASDRLVTSGQHPPWSYLRNEVRTLDYGQLRGNNFLHKVELLVAILT